MSGIQKLVYFLSVIFIGQLNYAIALNGESMIGGYYAHDNTYGYQVALSIGKKLCGGSIIGKMHIVTATHCLLDANGQLVKSPVKILAGSNNLKLTTTEEYKADKYFIPISFFDNLEGPPLLGDITVLMLRKPFNLEFDHGLRLLKLPSESDYTGNPVVLSSFGVDKLAYKPYYYLGKLKKKGSYSGRLQYTTAKILSRSECFGFLPQLREDQFCAQVEQSLTDDNQLPDGTCYGDSGSPLVYQETLVGILSSGPWNCDETHDATAYVNVSKHLPLIENALKNVCDTNFMYCNAFEKQN